nr:hypothetical protein [Bacteroidota bacterium]
MPYLDFHGASIHYEFHSTDSVHPPLVLVHGFLEDKRMWENLLPQRTAYGSVLAVDL